LLLFREKLSPELFNLPHAARHAQNCFSFKKKERRPLSSLGELFSSQNSTKDGETFISRRRISSSSSSSKETNGRECGRARVSYFGDCEIFFRFYNGKK
jgi:hypothetical protein